MTRVLAWALYDLANTFFAVAMLSFYFPLWVTQDQGARELVYLVPLAISMAAVGLAMPLCGVVSDATGVRMRYLRAATLGCVVATCLIGLTASLPLALGLFIVANFCYQLGTVFYDALIRTVAHTERLGEVSGLGAAFGYLGSMAGLLILWPFVRAGGHQEAFVPAGICFLLFALPSFLLIREGTARPSPGWGTVVTRAFRQLRQTLRAARGQPGFWRFLWAYFWSLNAINTVLVSMGVYARTVMGLEEGQLIGFFVFSQSFAVVGALVLGRLVPRWGAKETLMLVWIGWAAALGLLVISPSPRWLWVIGPVIGFCLGPTWAVSRIVVVQLAPADRLAEMFGLAGLFGRVSAILGPVLWGLIVWDPARYTQGLLVLVGLLGLGLWLLRGVPVPRLTARPA